MGSAEAPAVPVPSDVRISFAHAATQWLADEHDVQLLHIKGAALDESIRHASRMFTDADILVRPDQAQRFVAVLAARGWRVQTSFAAGSATGHSATLHHDVWGYLDLHRDYPGFGPTPEAAFQAVWASRGSREIGGLPCAVPDLPTQALVVLLHAARSFNQPRQRDIEFLWTEATSEQRRAILQAVEKLHAQVGFSVIEGRLEEYRHEPTYALWKVWSEGGTRVDEWRARLRAEPSLRGKLAVVRLAPLVNVEHLAVVRGRPVTRREVVSEFFGRAARALREELRRRGRRGPS